METATTGEELASGEWREAWLTCASRAGAARGCGAAPQRTGRGSQKRSRRIRVDLAAHERGVRAPERACWRSRCSRERCDRRKLDVYLVPASCVSIRSTISATRARSEASASRQFDALAAALVERAGRASDEAASAFARIRMLRGGATPSSRFAHKGEWTHNAPPR